VTQGFRYYMSSINAAIGLEQLKKVGTFLARRRDICGRYDRAFQSVDELRALPINYNEAAPHMKIYAHYGFNDFVLCLGYKGEIIKEYFYNYELYTADFSVCLGPQKKVEIHSSNDQLDWRVSLVDTGEQALKGARIKRIEHLIDGDDFMLTYGDGVANINIRNLVEFHRAHGKIATVTGVHPPSLFGELQVRGDKVEIFAEKPQTSSGLISGGFFVLSHRLFSYLTDDDSCDLERGTLERLADEGQLMVCEHRGDWACVDTHRDLQHVNHLWNTNEPFWKVWR
jgi:glucose-1-phosphate cytidylyltransferase